MRQLGILFRTQLNKRKFVFEKETKQKQINLTTKKRKETPIMHDRNQPRQIAALCQSCGYPAVSLTLIQHYTQK